MGDDKKDMKIKKILTPVMTRNENKLRCAVTMRPYFEAAIGSGVMSFFKNFGTSSCTRDAHWWDIRTCLPEMYIPCITKNYMDARINIIDCKTAVISKEYAYFTHPGRYTIETQVVLSPGYDMFSLSNDDKSPIMRNAHKCTYQDKRTDEWVIRIKFKDLVEWSCVEVNKFTEEVTGIKFKDTYAYAYDSTGRSLNSKNKDDAKDLRRNAKEIRKFMTMMESIKKGDFDTANKDISKAFNAAIKSFEDVDNVKNISELVNNVSHYSFHYERLLDVVDYVLLTFTEEDNHNSKFELKIIY